MPSPRKKSHAGNKKIEIRKSIPTPKPHFNEDGENGATLRKSTYSKSARAALLASADVRTRLIALGGENTIEVIREFDKDMSDEELARKTGIKTSDVRVVLNRLHSQGFFSYARLRDRESGWYSYVWRMSESRLKEFYNGVVVEGTGEKTEIGTVEGYRCPGCAPGEMVGFEDAMDLNFKCNGCGSALEYVERKRR